MSCERYGIPLLLSLIALMSAAPHAIAQAYPVRPVRMIVPYPAGGGTDIISRLVAQKLSEKWGSQIIVDNRGGANGIIGTELAAKAKPDGYTFAVIIATQAINPALYPKLPYSEADLIPVTLMAQYPFILTVHPSVPAKSAREFIALAKKRPGEMSYASSGNGSGPHLGFELFKITAGINVVHVPYKGAGPANIDLISGQVQAFFNNVLAARPHMDARKLRVLAVSSLKRSRALPEVITLAESGLAGFDVTGWYGVIAPAGTPGAIVSKIQTDIAAVLQTPDIGSKLIAEGAEPVGSTTEAFTKFLQSETQKWAQVVKTAGIKLD
ncbi:MAG: tripartite tricarboxylate transporter substrate binding protein [Pseudomonadota bacterium]